MTETARSNLVAAFDIGSNSAKLTIASVDSSGAVTELANYIETTRLGHEIDRTGRIADDRAAATLAALERMNASAIEAGVGSKIGVATEAVRVASNGASFLAEISDRFGINVVQIDGNREAELTYQGLATMRPLIGPVLMLDIGGASTEVVAGDGPTILHAVSLPLGSGRLTDTIISNDPPTRAELSVARIAASDMLGQLSWDQRSTGTRLIISGGTGGYLTAFLDGKSELTLPEIDAAQARVALMPAAELAPLIGAGIERARVLPAGIAIILAAIDRENPHSIETAPSGLRIGLIQAAAKGAL